VAAGLEDPWGVSEICEVAEPGKLWLGEPVSEISEEGEIAGLALPDSPGLSVIPKEFVWNGLKVS